MKIDLNIWVTQQALADELGISIQAVHNWVQRGKIKIMRLPGNTTLVNKNSVEIDTKRGRPRKKGQLNSRPEPLNTHGDLNKSV